MAISKKTKVTMWILLGLGIVLTTSFIVIKRKNKKTIQREALAEWMMRLLKTQLPSDANKEEIKLLIKNQIIQNLTESEAMKANEIYKKSASEGGVGNISESDFNYLTLLYNKCVSEKYKLGS